MSLSRPVFDHLVINARDRLDEAEARYRSLGFALTQVADGWRLAAGDARLDILSQA